MTANIKLSPIQSYDFSLKEQTPVKTTGLYALALRIFSTIKSGLYAAIHFIDRSFSKIDCSLNSISLRCAKIQSSGLSAINHAYKDAPLEQKRALESYILDKLDEKLPATPASQRQVLARKIAQDHKIYDIGGLCLGYSWLFAAYVLSHKQDLSSAETLKTRFIEDVTTRLAPIVSFASYVDFDELVKVQGKKIIVQGETLRHDSGSFLKEQEAINALRHMAYPTFKLESGPSASSIKEQITEHRAFLSSVHKAKLTDFLSAKVVENEMKTRFGAIMNANECLKASNLEEQIIAHGKFYDDKALVVSIPTQDPTSGHAMCIYASQKTGKFIFFDPNLGVTCFSSLTDLAKGVSTYSKSMYGATKANYFDAISL